MSNSGERFESYVRFVYQILLQAQGKNITVNRRADVSDNRGNVYNVDVFYEFTVAGTRHRVAVECKDTHRPIERDEVIAFAGKIQDMPSTIGVFISRNGFQRGAKKYLDDHGISAYTEADLPRFAEVVGTRIATVALPDGHAVGQPFWGLMQFADDHVTGTWCGMPDGSAFVLFFSKRHAELFLELAFRSSKDVCVRGIEQATLNLLLGCFGGDPRGFAIARPIETDGRTQFLCEQWTAQELRDEFCHIAAPT